MIRQSRLALPLQLFQRANAQGARKIDFAQFKQALKLIAEEKRVLVEQVEALVVKSGGPRRNGTPTDFVRLHDDKSTFTGAPPTYPSGSQGLANDAEYQVQIPILTHLRMLRQGCMQTAVHQCLISV